MFTMAETHPPIRCCRCAVEIKDRHDDEARVRLGLLFGHRPSLIWKNDAPWRYVDLCVGCAKALDGWIEAGLPVPGRSWTSPTPTPTPTARERAEPAIPEGGSWLWPLAADAVAPLAGRRTKVKPRG
jgi:hypothetical protein